MKIFGRTMTKDDWIVVGGIGVAVTAAIAVGGLFKPRAEQRAFSYADEYAQLPAGSTEPPDYRSELGGIIDRLNTVIDRTSQAAPSSGDLGGYDAGLLAGFSAATRPQSRASSAPSGFTDPYSNPYVAAAARDPGKVTLIGPVYDPVITAVPDPITGRNPRPDARDVVRIADTRYRGRSAAELRDILRSGGTNARAAAQLELGRRRADTIDMPRGVIN